MSENDGKNVLDRRIELSKQIALVNLIGELGDAIDRYYVPDLFRRYKNAILPDLFENESDYEFFINGLHDFLITYQKILKTSRLNKDYASKRDVAINKEHDKINNIISELMKRFPNQFDKWVLLHVFLENGHTGILSESTKFLRGKKVYLEYLTQDSQGYRYIDILSTDEYREDFVMTANDSSRTVPKKMREYSQAELEFLTNIKYISAIELLSPQDFVYCAKNSRYAEALFFNLLSYIEFSKGKKSDETINSLVTLISASIQYLDLNKLKTMILYRSIQLASITDITVDSESVRYTEEIINEFLKLGKRIKSIKIDFEEFSLDVVDFTGIKFDILEQRRENQIRTNKPLCVLSNDSNVQRKKVTIDKKIEVTTHDTIRLAEEYLRKKDANRVLIACENKDVSGITFEFKSASSIRAFRTMIVNRVRLKHPDADIEQLEDLCTEYTKNVILFLYENKRIDLLTIKKIDENVAAELIVDGSIEVNNVELEKKEFSKPHIVFICNLQPERAIYFIDNNLITKEELFMVRYVSKELVTTLFNAQRLTLDEILNLVSEQKITVDELKECELDKDILSNFIDAEVLANLYISVMTKKQEYEEKTRIHIKTALEQGISEEEIPSLENEEEIQREIQSAIDQKRLYAFWVEFSKMNSQEKIEFSELALAGVFDKLEYQDFCRVASEMYQDGIIDMDTIIRLEPRVVIELIKSFVIKTDDLEKFKNTMVTAEEISTLREICENEEEFQKEFNVLRYKNLEQKVNSIINDSSLSQEEKLGIIYNIYSLNTDIENRYIEYYENAILTGIFDTKFEILQNNYGRSDKGSRKRKHEDGEENIDKSENENNYVYPANIIWMFMRLLDPDIFIKVYKDGNVVFRSEKLNKVMIESVWNGDGDGIKRSYGVTSIVMDLKKFDDNISQIVVPSKNGYRINTIAAKELLPRIETKKGFKLDGLVRHDKDLKNTGKRVWFDLLLDNFGINLQDIKEGKSTKYTPEHTKEIEAFLEKARTSHKNIGR